MPYCLLCFDFQEKGYFENYSRKTEKILLYLYHHILQTTYITDSSYEFTYFRYRVGEVNMRHPVPGQQNHLNEEF